MKLKKLIFDFPWQWRAHIRPTVLGPWTKLVSTKNQAKHKFNDNLSWVVFILCLFQILELCNMWRG